MSKHLIWIKDLRKKDVPIVGGKNSSMGEMYSQLTKKGIRIPNAFALTSDSFWYFLKHNNLDTYLKETFSGFDAKNIKLLRETSRDIIDKIKKAEFPEDLKEEIIFNYHKLSEEHGGRNVDVAVRSSATAEDLPTASFAGQHETLLNISGETELLKAVKQCISSLYTARAIAYREEKGFDQLSIALSTLVQKMVRSDISSSGIMFTLDTESGFRDVVKIDAIYGVGEMIVQGKITPDSFMVHKPTLEKGFKSLFLKNIGRKNRKYIYSKSGGLKEVAVSKKEQQQFCLTEDEVLTLAKWAVIIEKHYGMPMDMEWAKDGKTNQLYVVQARPETVHAQEEVGASYKEYKLTEKATPVVEGIAVGDKIGQGTVHVIHSVEGIESFKEGEVLVTKMTDPDWVPIMRIASAIITDEGGSTSHAAIVSRELGVPCIVGTKNGSKKLQNIKEATVDCSQGRKGKVYNGKVPFKIKKYNLKEVPKLPVKITMNLGEPESAFKYSYLPVDGVGLAREEFIISNKIKIHPLALLNYDNLNKLAKKGVDIKKIKNQINILTTGYKTKLDYYIDELAEGVSQIGAAFYPKQVIVRFSDFKSNEYETLIGGSLFEPKEENPMIGWRGASRYYDSEFKEAFKLECKAIKKTREIYGLENIAVMIPFCRTPEEAQKVIAIMKEADLIPRKKGLKLYIMCEIPSNIILAEQFLDLCDGMSIGSNDLTQLMMGVDRDSTRLSKITNEFNPAVKEVISSVIKKCKKEKKYIGICGDAPSTISGFIDFLIEEGIDTVSLSPDVVVKTLFKFNKK